MRILALKSIFLAKFMSEASLNQWIMPGEGWMRENKRHKFSKKKKNLSSTIRCDVFQVIICRSGIFFYGIIENMYVCMKKILAQLL